MAPTLLAETSTDQQLQAFISRTRLLLTRERDAEIKRSALLLTNCGQKVLEQKGLALGALGVAAVNVGLGGKTLVELERPSAYHSTPIFPPHTFRPGDLARVEENVSGSGPTKKAMKSKKAGGSEGTQSSKGVEGVVYKVSDTRLTLAIDPSAPGADDIDLPERCRIVKLANSVTYDRMEKAVDQLERIVLPPELPPGSAEKYTPPRTKLVEVLFGVSPPSAKIKIEGLSFFDDSLNPSQRDAVRFALESPEFACIHGPPGTGKTHTLVEIIRQLTSATPANPKPQRLLVCGASNLAVDNILERLLALSPAKKSKDGPLRATRVGHPARVMANADVLDATLEARAGRSDQAALANDVKVELETLMSVLSGKGKGAKGKAPRGPERKKMWEEVRALRKEYRQREGGVVKTVLGESQVVVATCHSSGGRQLRYHDFDVVIIDEATQAIEAVCWVPIFKAKKLILAGDPLQLPPTVLSLDRPGGKGKTTDKASLKAGNDAKKIGQRVAKPADNAAIEIAPALGGQDESHPSSGSEDKSEESDIDEDGPVPSASEPPAPDLLKKQSKVTRSGLQPPRTLETTLFARLERMYGPGIKHMLDVQYRMHAQIADFPSKALYQNKLKSHASVAAHLLRDLPNVHVESEEDAKELLGTPVVFFDTAGCEYYERLEGNGDEGSRCNENEATVVKNWVESLVNVGVLPSQIAVVTPYQAQVSLLATLLRPSYGAELEIGSVDGMQGREKDAVVISLVRSNEKRDIGFLKEKRRLNVAMTRARRSLCIVGDSETLKHGNAFLKKWMAWLEANADVRYAGLD